MPFRQREKGTEQTSTLSESAQPGAGSRRIGNRFMGLYLSDKSGMEAAGQRRRLGVANDMAARLCSGKQVEEMRLPCRRNALARLSAKDSEKVRKGNGADCDFFGGSKKCKFRLSQFPPVPVSPQFPPSRAGLSRCGAFATRAIYIINDVREDAALLA